MPTLFGLGSIAVGSFPAIQISQPRRDASWTSYERLWEGVPLFPTDFVISADEKTSVQARRRKQLTLPGASGRPMRVEHKYFREGAWTYLAAWDVHRAKLFGRCEKKSGIAPTDRLMAEVMTQEPYRSAHPACPMRRGKQSSVSPAATSSGFQLSQAGVRLKSSPRRNAQGIDGVRISYKPFSAMLDISRNLP